MTPDSANQNWEKFSVFRVISDHKPMPGFRLVMQLAPARESISRIAATRARSQDPLDPALSQAVLRAGVGLLQSQLLSFVYANTEEVLVLVREDAVGRLGNSNVVYEHVLSQFASRLSLIVGEEVIVRGQIYEFPDLGIVRRAFVAALDWVEESAPARASIRVSDQMRGTGRAPDPLVLRSIEGQHNLIRNAGIDLESLPGWWWRGIAARFRRDGGVDLHDELPGGEKFSALVAD